jgi:hypothetical protein
MYSKNGAEGITSIQGGCIGTAGYDEIVVSTYNGKQKIILFRENERIGHFFKCIFFERLMLKANEKSI